jgi:pyruvate formate lyase activating enzyme
MIKNEFGMVFDIQRYSLHDGPGLRVLVFFKGCPLTCVWCSNPESQSFDMEIMYDFQLCRKDCAKCAEVCATKAIKINAFGKVTLENSTCNLCGTCIDVCPAHALKFVGRKIDAADILFEIERDLPFLRRSGGGVTLGGGEPTSQPAFAYRILKACHDSGIHTAIETCGYASWDILRMLSDVTDLFLYDIKQIDRDKHTRLTGKDNRLILDNLCRLSEIHSNVIVRYPLIPGHNDNEGEILSLVHFVKKLKNINRIELSPYHCLGQTKYEMLFRKYPLKDLKTSDPNNIDSVLKIIKANGLDCESLH